MVLSVFHPKYSNRDSETHDHRRLSNIFLDFLLYILTLYVHFFEITFNKNKKFDKKKFQILSFLWKMIFGIYFQDAKFPGSKNVNKTSRLTSRKPN